MDDPYPSLPTPSPRKRHHDEVDDPYSDLPSSTSKVKKSSIDTMEAKEEKKQEIPSTVTEEEGKPKVAIDIGQMIQKLHGYLLNDKKFPKASRLFGALLEEQCQGKPTEERMAEIMNVLNDLIKTKRDRIHHLQSRGDFATLFRLVDKHREKLLVATEYDSDTIDNWILDAVIHNELFTDDTYLFAKSAKQVATHITMRRDHAIEMENLQDVESIDAALLPCLETLMKRHGTSWAKTSVEMVLALCTTRRLSFHEEARKQIDEWTSIIHKRKVAPNNKLSTGAEMRKNIVAYNDTQTGINVGKSNHPLYNKE